MFDNIYDPNLPRLEDLDYEAELYCLERDADGWKYAYYPIPVPEANEDAI